MTQTLFLNELAELRLTLSTDVLRQGLRKANLIPNSRRVERGKFTTMELEKLWRHADSDYFVIHDGVRRPMRRA